MIIDENNVGIRIDKYLTDNTEYTRSKIQKMIDNGNISKWKRSKIKLYIKRK